MCYLIAKRIDAVGCIALRTSHGKHLVEFKRSLADMVAMRRFNWLRSVDLLRMQSMNRISL